MTTPLREPLASPDTQCVIWKDEMNLSELPLSTISERVPEGLRTLDFCVTDADGETVRRVSVIPPGDDQLQKLVEVAYPGLVPNPSADPRPVRRRKGGPASQPALPPKAAKLLASIRGLPNAIDDDVLLALIQLTRKHGFASRRVDFSLYEVVKLLGWDNSSKSYTRVIVSLLRWKAVLLTYHDSWRDNAEKRYVTRTFNMLDEVSIFTSQGRRSRGTGDGQSQLPLSSFAWSEAMFKSFDDGFLKNLDFGVYKGFHSRIAKRMYRHLDKCFGRLKGGSVSFDLRDFACGNIGLVGDYEPWKLKQVLAPAIRELEEKGVIVPVAAAERYEAVARGKWRIVFQPCRPVRLPAARVDAPAAASTLVATLLRRGVTRATAEGLAAEFTAARIELQLDVLEWWQSTGREPGIKEPAAWLVRAVRDDYAPPKEYEPKADRERKQAAADARRKADDEVRRRREAAERQVDAERAAAEAARRAHVDGYLASLSPTDRAEFEREAVAKASGTYRSHIERGDGMLAQVSRRLVIEEAVLRACPMARSG